VLRREQQRTRGPRCLRARFLLTFAQAHQKLAAQPLDLLSWKGRATQHIGQNAEDQRKIFGQCAPAETATMHPAAGIDGRAKRLGLGHDLLEGAPGRAANQRCTGKDCQAILLGRLVRRTNTHIAAHAYGWAVGITLNQRYHAIRHDMSGRSFD
jgi:hypothetical protein